MLIDAQLGEHHNPGSVRQTVWLPVIVLVLLMLLPGAPIVHESGFRQLARALECTSRCNAPPVSAARQGVIGGLPSPALYCRG